VGADYGGGVLGIGRHSLILTSAYLFTVPAASRPK
jgi:hypothetical protein